MAEQRLIDANALRGIESLLNTDIIQASKEASWLMSQVLHDIDAMSTIDPETLPIVQQLRAELANCKQELRQIKYCYDIAKNGEKQFRKQNDEITAAWAECAKKLKQVTAERDAAVKSRAKLAEYELTVCEEFCYGDAQHDIPPCEWLVDGKCALREWVKAND